MNVDWTNITDSLNLVKSTTYSNGWATVSPLVVVMFILSTLAFITVPYFAAPGAGEPSEETGVETLAALMVALKQTTVKEGRDYLLHLDSTNGRVWAAPADAWSDESPGSGFGLLGG